MNLGIVRIQRWRCTEGGKGHYSVNYCCESTEGGKGDYSVNYCCESKDGTLFVRGILKPCACACRLFLITSMSNPHYLPAVCIEVTIINFIVTFDGLQEQLLSSVVKQENPQLETQR